MALEFQQNLIANYHSLFQEGRHSDVTLVVCGAEFKAHKLILASQSSFFEAMFYNDATIEAHADRVDLKETDPELFALLLQIIYDGCLDNVYMNDADLIVRLYMLVERYQLVRFDGSYLHEIGLKLLRPENFWHYLDVAVYYNVQPFIDLCFEYFDYFVQRDKSAKSLEQSGLFQQKDFTKISHDTLKVLLDRNFNCCEFILLRGTLNWIEANVDSITSNEKWILIKKIRLCLIGERYLLNNEFDLRELDLKDLREALLLIQTRYPKLIESYLEVTQKVKKHDSNYYKLAKKACSSILQNRSFLIENYNVCQEDFGFQISSECNGSIDRMELDLIEKPVELMISLGFPFKLNYIEMLMSDMKGDKYSYVLEYSVDGFNWFTLYDYRKYLCSNYQTLFFKPIVSRYFRIKGFRQTRLDNRTRKAFRSIKSFKAYYKQVLAAIDVQLCHGVLSSSYHSCQIKHRVYCDTTVNISNVERYYCQLLPVEVSDQDQTSAEKPGKPLYILMDQPVVMSSFAFKLYDISDCSYSYLVDIFDANKLSWECVADRSKEQCTSWQNVVFSARPVNLVRIVGTKIYNSPCSEFRIVKFNFNKS